MKVLSLCDGISCGRIALQKAGVGVENYFASEIKKIAIAVTNYNYPDTIQVGDVRKIKYENGILYTEAGNFQTDIDLVIWGSPCQSFSVAMKSTKRIGLADKERSGLFFECYRIFQEVRPSWFLMENVANMRTHDREFISSLLGVTPIRINSSLVSAALRDRFYWTNIPNITPPEDRHILLQDILISGYTDRLKARALLASDSRPLKSKEKMLHRYKATRFTTLIWEEKGNDDSVRYMNQDELERCQTVPQGYTKILTRNEAANVLGDGWTVDVIAHIFKNIPKDKKMKET